MKNKRASMFQLRTTIEKNTPSPFRRSSIRERTFQQFRDNSHAKRRVLKDMTFHNKENMTDIISKITNACYNMCTKFTGDNAIMNNMRSIAEGQSRRLSVQMKRIQHQNDLMNLQYYETYSDNPNILSPSKLRTHSKPANVQSENEEELSYSEISIADYDNEKNRKQAKKLNKYFLKKSKLDKLKGEIMLMEQRKKYNINNTFEKPKLYSHSQFIRTQNPLELYEPKFRYNKENIAYLKRYNQQDKKYKPQKTIMHKSNLQLSKLSTENVMSNQDNNELYNTQNSKVSSDLSIVNNLTSCNTYSRSFLSTAHTTHKYNFYEPSKKNNKGFSSVFRLYKKPKKEMEDNPVKLLSMDESKEDKRFSTTISSFRAGAANPLKKIKELQSDVHKRGNNLTLNIERDREYFEESKKKPKPMKEKFEFNLQNVIDEFKFDLNKTKVIDENKLLLSNAEKVSKILDEKSRVILSQLINEMLCEQSRLNISYNQGSNYDRQLKSIQQKKEFKLVSDQTMALKKYLSENKTIEPKNEREKIIKLMKSINKEDFEDDNYIKELSLKARVMKNIKPLLYKNRNIKKRERKNKI